MKEISITPLGLLYLGELLFYQTPESQAQVIESHITPNFTELLLFINDNWENDLIDTSFLGDISND